MRRSWVWVFIIIFVGLRAAAQIQIASIDSLQKNLYFLASDSLKGRGTGQPGQQLAADFIAKSFQRYGLQTLNNQSYFHHFKLNRDHRNYVVVKSEGNLLFWPWHFYYVSNYNHIDTLKNNLVFVGFGSKPEIDSMQVKNQAIALIADSPEKAYQTIRRIRQEYGNKSFFVIFPTKNKALENAWSANYYLADYQLPGDYNKNKLKKNTQSWTTALDADSVNIFYCFPDVLHNLFLKSDAQLFEIAKQAANGKILGLQQLPKPLINTKINYSNKTESIDVVNVAGIIKGHDTTKTIIVSAHYDHLGEEMGRVFYGADDNASGTVALLENARLAMRDVNLGLKPEVNLLFIAFSAEELGLFGSKAFVESNLFNAKQTLLNINMDMVGRWDAKHEQKRNFVYLLTAGHNKNVFQKLGKHKVELPQGFKVSTNPGAKERLVFRFGSDHYSFLTKNVPVVVLFTGLHDDYHTPQDTPDKINYKNLTNISTFAYRYVYQIAYQFNTLKLK
jgi:hypothetical protein